MNRNAEVALTLGDDTNLNRLRVPEFALLRLCVLVGAKASKSYLQPGAPKQKDSGADDFHFVPEKETGGIAYEIDDVCGVIAKAKLELFCRFKKDPLWTLDLTKLGPDAYCHGKHSLKWDGRVVTPDKVQEGQAGKDGMEHDLTKYDPDLNVHKDGFPDGYITLEYTPYKLKLTVSDKDDQCVLTAWTFFQILLKGIVLELGPEEAVPAATVDDDRHKRDKAVRKQIADDGGLPAAAATRKVYLVSNLFKTAAPDGQMTDNTGYEEFRTLWGDGPNIPLIAKIRLADSADNEVKLEDGPGAKALGKTKFLWDWEDVAEDTSRHHAKAKTFLNDALNYDKITTKPKGDNGHIDRGGKRGPDGQPVFPDQPGYAPKDALDAGRFPFEVKAAEIRKWVAHSLGWTQGKLKGQTGVLFQPSRLAGDTFKVTVYLDNDRYFDSVKSKEKLVLDVTDLPLKAAEVIKKSTGKFEMWRQLEVINYLKKKATVTPDINLGTVADYYEKANILMKNLAGAAGAMVKATYNTAMTNAINTQAWHVKAAVSANDQHDTGGHFIDYRDHAGWCGEVDTHANGAGWTNVQKLAWSAGLSNGAGSDPYTNAAVYYQFLYDWALGIIEAVCGNFMVAGDGINIFQFHNLFNPTLPRGTSLNGFAADPPGSNRTKCGFIQCGSNYGGTLGSGAANLNTREQTCTHEIGHQLFLPHTWQVSPAHDPQGTHDKNDNACTMSYEFDKTRRFCGLCLLRLRGWSKFKTDATGAEAAPATRTLKDTGSNKHP